jgi:hypothetical protein
LTRRGGVAAPSHVPPSLETTANYRITIASMRAVARLAKSLVDTQRDDGGLLQIEVRRLELLGRDRREGRAHPLEAGLGGGKSSFVVGSLRESDRPAYHKARRGRTPSDRARSGCPGVCPQQRWFGSGPAPYGKARYLRQVPEDS